MKIKNLSLIDRPREKILRYGVNKLTNVELLAAVLAAGNKKADILELAQKINELLLFKQDPSLKDLDQIKNLGLVKKLQVLAVLELGKRLFSHKQAALILKPEDVWQELGEIRVSKKEHFVIFYLDVKNQILKKEIISIGNLNSSIVHPREVFEKAIINSSAQIIIAHNHPSGDCELSKTDLATTTRLVKAGKILDIEIIDHVIVTKDKWLSMKKEKLI
jgi:DNA repair protein RadC